MKIEFDARRVACYVRKNLNERSDSMPDFMDIIKERRSVRKYQDREVPDDILREILEAARWAPSWANTQCWEIIAVKDKEIREKLQGTISQKNPATKAIVAAPVLLVLCGQLKKAGYYKKEASTKFGDWFMFDLGIAAQNICLAAHHLGLGTVIVGSFDHGEAKKIVSAPDDCEAVVMIPLGYPVKIPSAPKRRAIDEFTHRDTF